MDEPIEKKFDAPGFNIDALMQRLVQGGVYTPEPVTEQPEIYLRRWSIWRIPPVEGKSGESIHFLGDTGRDGRVSSPIQVFDAETLQGRTRSGRVYKLSGEPSFPTKDAAYVFGVWLGWMDLDWDDAVNITDAMTRKS